MPFPLSSGGDVSSRCPPGPRRTMPNRDPPWPAARPPEAEPSLALCRPGEEERRGNRPWTDLRPCLSVRRPPEVKCLGVWGPWARGRATADTEGVGKRGGAPYRVAVQGPVRSRLAPSCGPGGASDRGAYEGCPGPWPVGYPWAGIGALPILRLLRTSTRTATTIAAITRSCESAPIPVLGRAHPLLDALAQDPARNGRLHLPKPLLEAVLRVPGPGAAWAGNRLRARRGSREHGRNGRVQPHGTQCSADRAGADRPRAHGGAGPSAPRRPGSGLATHGS